MEPYIYRVPFNEQRSRHIAGAFVYYLAGPASIALRFDSVTQPGNQAGATFNVLIKPGDSFELPAGHEFQTLSVLNRTNTGETRIDLMAGFGKYVIGPEPIVAPVLEPRLDYMAVVQTVQTLFRNMGFYLANHFDSAKTLYVTDIQLVDQDVAVNTNPEDWVFLYSGRNGTTASSSDDDELGEHDGEICVNLVSGGPLRATPTDHRFSTVSAGQVGVCWYAALIDSQAGGARWRSGLEAGPAGLSHLNMYSPSFPAPIVLPPGYTAVLRSADSVNGYRKEAEVNYSWYEQPVGT